MKKTSTQHVTAKKIMAASQKITGILLLMLLSAGITHAQIPGTITGTHIVSTSESSTGDCVVAPGGRLVVNSGATATINGDLIVQESGIVNIYGGTVKMSPGKRILIKGFSSHSGAYGLGGFLYADDNALITTAVPGQFWKGIEVARAQIPTTPITKWASFLRLNNSTVSYSEHGVSNFNTQKNVIAMRAGGLLNITDVTFLNNRDRSVWIYFADSVDQNGDNTNLYFTGCTFSVTDDFPYNPSELVKLHTCTNVPFKNCTFEGKNTSAPPMPGTIGLLGIYSSVRIEPDATGNPGSHFSNLKYGIYITNQLDQKSTLVKDATFYCKYAITLNGCINPLLWGNNSYGPLPGIDNDYCSFFLENCPTYIVENNIINYDIGTPNDGFRGIVVKNGGAGDVSLYGNTVMSTNIDIQSIGTNRASSGLGGLKILCNDLGHPQVEEYNITVMKDPLNSTNNGISNIQYLLGVPPFSFDRSAANLFTSYTPAIPDPLNYYLEPGTNDTNDFTYKYYAGIPPQNPTHRNFPIAQSVGNYNCPIIYPGNPSPYSFSTYARKVKLLEQKIGAIEATLDRKAEDTLALISLIEQHSRLIDSIVNYYQSINRTDSIALVYEQITKGYHYQVYLALAYKSLGRYKDADRVLNNIAGHYHLSGEEASQIENLATIFATLEWLQEHHRNWSAMPAIFKKPVYEYETGDRMYAGAIARSLLTEYEGRIYPPVYRTPEKRVMPMAQSFTETVNKIYPSPADDHLFVNWDSDTSGVFTLTDINGRTVVQKKLFEPLTIVEISKLPPGLYLAQIQSQGKTTYQQKIVKQ